MTPLRLDHVCQDRGSGRRQGRVLHDVSLSIESGELVLLEGPSGAGKSTLLGVAAGLLTPSSGEVTLAGLSLRGATPRARRDLRARSVGFVFQRANLVANLTARDNVRLMAELAGMTAADGAARADALLERVGLRGLRHRFPHELSGGEEQRVAVARAVVHRPAVVLADEPTASLDGISGRAVTELLIELARAVGSAVLVSTYDPRLGPYADRRLAILDGQLGPIPLGSGTTVTGNTPMNPISDVR